MTRQIRFAHFVTFDRRSYQPGDIATFPSADASALVSAGQAGYVTGLVDTPPRTAMRSDTFNLLSVEQETVPWWTADAGTVAMTSGLARFAMFTARRTMTAGGVRVLAGDTAAGGTPTLVKLALYSADSSRDLTFTALTRIAVTASDVTVFAAANTSYSTAFITPTVIDEGARYAVGVLVVTAATAPTVWGIVGGAAYAGPWYGAQAAGQTDLAASYTAGALANTPTVPYATVPPVPVGGSFGAVFTATF
jgi:hypothetical protein